MQVVHHARCPYRGHAGRDHGIFMTLYDRYTMLEKLHESSETVIHRALRLEDRLPVIVKAPRGEYPTPRALARLQHEYSLLRGLELPGVIRVYGLERSGHGLALIEEDFGGRPLDQLMREARLDRTTVLRIAAAVAGTLAALHALPIVHKDIKPHNILLQPSTGQVKLIDFSLATRLSQESHGPGALEGTLAYMSPEQTGRMNRVVDVRSDLYSLGVTLYELLTGVLPFQATDPAELIHSHIARRPVAPRERDPSIPQVLSDLVLKLLAKAAEARYQTAHGLRADLETCLESWRQTGDIAGFPLGRVDRDGELRLPQRLYGREEETQVLLAALARVRRGSAELVLLSGPAGVGKSALVQEAFKGLAQRDASFVVGKFDQLARHVPYAPIAQALRQLMRELLTEAPAELERRRRALQAALGGNGQLLVNLVPELGVVIGPQPAPPELGPTEAKNRFALAFQNFFRVMATADHPLVLVVDDLQWADPASLKLLEILLLDPDAGNLLIVAGYRDQDLDAVHPLRATLVELRRACVPITEIGLQPLGSAQVAALLADALGCDQPRATPLAELVFEKTGGNPFFLGQFLGALFKERLLGFDLNESAWRWDLTRIAEAQVTSNVVEFMAGKLRDLAEGTRRLLMLAACIGHRFDLGTLAALDERSYAATVAEMWEAIREGLVLPIGGDYRFLLGEGALSGAAEPLPGAAEQTLQVSFRFLHDRVQQAAYSMIPEPERQRLHLRIGQRLLAQRGARPADEDLFETVNHLNVGAALIVDEQERLALAHLNLAAARRAKAATAHATAASHGQAGIRCLTADAWRSEHALCFALHVESAECEYLSGQLPAAEQLFELLLTHAQAAEQRVQVYALRIALYTTLGRFLDAIAAGRTALRMFGVDLPEDEAGLQAALQAVLTNLTVTRAGRSIEALIDAPALTDPEQHAISRLAMELVAPAYFTSPTLFSLLAVRMVDISQQYGHSELSAYGYLAYGFLLAAAMGQPAEAHAFGRLGLAVHERFHSAGLASRLNFLFGIYQHLCQPLRTALPYLHRALQTGMETGDFTYASFAAHHIGFTRVGLGDDLAAVGEEVDRFLALMQRTQDTVSVRTLTITRQAIAGLRGRTRGVHTLNDENFDEASFLGECEAAGFTMGRCYFHFARLQLLYLHGDFAGALVMAERAEALQWAAFGLYYRTELPLYTLLTHAALVAEAPPEARAGHIEAIERHLAQVSAWATGCPQNFEHQRLLGAAELARVTDRIAEALGLYEQAIAAAQQAGFVQVAAIASELCARLHRGRGRGPLASFYLHEAFYGFVRWGASAKAELLAAQHPELADTLREGPMPGITTTTAARTGARAGTLDVAAVLRAAQTIAGEMVFGNVVDQLMRGVLTTAGAQRGFLLVPQAGELVLEAAADAESTRVEVGLGRPLDAGDPLAAAVVHFVARTRETVVLGEATSDPRFAGDPHIVRTRPRSLLCLALLHQGRLSAILYLENNSLADAFTAERVELLRLLSSQAATAIENARLYADVQRTSAALRRANEQLELDVSERTEELRAAASRLHGANDTLLRRGEELRLANEQLQAELGERQRAEQQRAALQQQVIAVQQARLEEMSTPLVPITEDIVAMPLIGSMDAARAQQVLETALSGAQRHHARFVILDITGMLQVDAQIAATLVGTAGALRLLGSKAVLTGVGPAFADLLASLNLDMRGLVTRGTLQAGIAYALGREGTRLAAARR